jgi:hypothetical protein
MNAPRSGCPLNLTGCIRRYVIEFTSIGSSFASFALPYPPSCTPSPSVAIPFGFPAHAKYHATGNPKNTACAIKTRISLCNVIGCAIFAMTR